MATPVAASSTPAPEIVMTDAEAAADADGPPAPTIPFSAPSAQDAPALAPGTFRSVLPGVEDLLELIYGIAEGADVASDDVAAKAKAVYNQLVAMKAAAAALPGGHMGTDGVRALSELLDAEAKQKREILRAFVGTPTPIADQMASGGEA